MIVTDITTFWVPTRVHPVSRTHEGWLFVRVHTDEGLVGLGEGSQGDPAMVRTYLEKRLRPELIGKDPTRIEPLATQFLARASGRAAATAVSAVEQALWDIWGQSLGQPIWALLGGKYRDAIPLYANINRATSDRSPKGHAESARKAVADGFRAVKCAPFDEVNYWLPDRASNRAGVRLGVERVAAIREAIGPDLALMVDCHGRFDVPSAIQVARELTDVGLTWLEEPVPGTDLDAIGRVHEQIPMALAGGESLTGRANFWDLVRRQTFDVIMPDVKHSGGILELRKIAALAETARLRVAPHNPSGPISTLASVQVCATIPNFLILEFPWGEVPWRHDLTKPAEEIVDGAIPVSNRPGLGYTLSEEMLRERHGEEW